jgi:hypothetical protein
MNIINSNRGKNINKKIKVSYKKKECADSILISETDSSGLNKFSISDSSKIYKPQ